MLEGVDVSTDSEGSTLAQPDVDDWLSESIPDFDRPRDEVKRST